MKDIRVSDDQGEGYQVIRTSGEIYLLISWYSDSHFLISCYPDNHITISHTGSDVQQRLPKNET
ncbi:MAG: hypothetical protein WBB67_03410 [bacterium]